MIKSGGVGFKFWAVGFGINFNRMSTCSLFRQVRVSIEFAISVLCLFTFVVLIMSLLGLSLFFLFDVSTIPR